MKSLKKFKKELKENQKLSSVGGLSTVSFAMLASRCVSKSYDGCGRLIDKCVDKD